MNELLETIDVFLTSANREIVKSAVGFVKVAVVCLKPETVRPYLSTLVPSLLNWSHQNANQFKTKIRHIFERLIRRFGADELEKLVGDDDRKLITNIRKRQQRAKRRKDESKAEQDNEDVQAEVSVMPTYLVAVTCLSFVVSRFLSPRRCRVLLMMPSMEVKAKVRTKEGGKLGRKRSPRRARQRG